jgi:uncharacterized protein (TIGR02145 family)
MKKNRLFFMLAALFVSAAVLFSCQKEEVVSLEDGVMLKALTIANDEVGSCEDDCIEPGSSTFYPVSDMASLSVGKNTKSVSYTAYNTETDFVVEVTYAITAGPSDAKAIITIDIDGDQVEYKVVNSGSTVSHTVPLAQDWAGCDEIAFSIVEKALGVPITFNESYALIPVCLGVGVGDVFNPTTGKTWMDRNLGATQVATSSTDADSYGDLYQWGRGTDGHQLRNSGTTATLSSSDNPGHGDFITINSGFYDWRSPQNNNLWQGVDGVNNPCPSGYRLPTDAEWDAERTSWGSNNNAAGAFASPLKLPVAGGRNGSGNGSLSGVGSYGYYWSGTVDGTFSRFLNFYSSGAHMNLHYQALGFSVRCLKD